MPIIWRMLLALTTAVVCQSVSAFIDSSPNQTAIDDFDLPQKAKVYEDSCVASLSTLNAAQASYWGGDPHKGFARSLKQLGPSGDYLIDLVLASGKKDDYRFVLTPGPKDSNGVIKHYTISARPSKVLVKKQRSFFTDETGVIRSTSEDRATTALDPAIQ